MENLEIYQKMADLKRKHGCTGTILVSEDGKIQVSDVENFTPGPLLSMMCMAALEASEKICQQMSFDLPESLLCISNTKRVMLRRAGRRIFVCIYDVNVAKEELFEAIENFLKELNEA
ncbi:MAG: hypothetical protein ACP5JR_07765 [Thermoplasmata archaeon]